MTKTFDPALADDVSEVRFHIGDVNTEACFLEDETIQARLNTYSGDIGKAVVSCLEFIITQLSIPSFSLDWLNVSASDARVGYAEVLVRKRLEFGVGRVTASSSITLPTRADSNDAETSEYDTADSEL